MILCDRADGIWTVTINRPDKANSLTHAMLSELAEVMEAATEARAVILTGTGRVFSAGADLEAARAGLATSDVWERLSGAVAALSGLTIAALNGTLAGGASGQWRWPATSASPCPEAQVFSVR
jgi:Enoyl-CoA hydratase/carnithine racemase